MYTRGYTLIEMMISIGMLTLMLGVVGFNYQSSRSYEIMKMENQRIASAIRAARARDFSTATKLVCSNDLTRACATNSNCLSGGLCKGVYPQYGYGVHFEQRYRVCQNDTSKSCYDHADCTGSNNCPTTSLNSDFRSSYVLFADFNDSSPYFSGGKSGPEFIEEIKVPKDYRPYFFDGASRCSNFDGAEVVFDSNILRYKKLKASSWSATTIYPANGLIMELWYAPGGTASDNVKTRNQHGRITTFPQGNSVDDALIANGGDPSFSACTS